MRGSLYSREELMAKYGMQEGDADEEEEEEEAAGGRGREEEGEDAVGVQGGRLEGCQLQGCLRCGPRGGRHPKNATSNNVHHHVCRLG